MATYKHKTEKIKTRSSRPGRTKEECAGHNGSHGWPTLAADLMLSFLVAKEKRESVRYEGGNFKKAFFSFSKRQGAENSRLEFLKNHFLTQDLK